MQMFILLSRFQKPLEEVNRFLTAHSVCFEPAAFPKRSSAFNAFAASPLNEYSPMQETSVHTDKV